MFLFLFGAIVDDRKCLSMGLCVYETSLHSIEKLQIISYFQPTRLEASRVSLEFVRSGLPGYQHVCSWPEWLFSLGASRDPLCETAF